MSNLTEEERDETPFSFIKFFDETEWVPKSEAELVLAQRDELLKAAKAVEAWIGHHKDWPLVMKLSAAIFKAEGRE